jgi:hypothetical protein
MLRIEPLQPIQRTKQQLHRKPTTDFQKILNKKLNIDDDQVYDTTTNDIIEDIDNLSNSTLRNLLKEE